MTTMYDALDDLKTRNLKRIAEIIVKYQKFKTDKVMEQIIKVKSVSLGVSTLANYINYGVAYLRYGTKHACLPIKLYAYIDECVNNHIQPLTPSLSEKRALNNRHKYTKKEVTLPIEKMSEIKNPITSTFIYGLKTDNRILTFNKEDDMKQFVKNMRYVAPDIKLQPVTVELDEVN